MNEKYYVCQIKPTQNTDRIEMIELDSPYLTLEQLHKWTESDTIDIIAAHEKEALQLQYQLGRLLIVLDDNGKIFRKEINGVGTYMYGEFPNDFLVGTILIGTDCKPKEDDEPDVYGMTEDQKQLLWEYICKSFTKLDEMFRKYA